MERKSGGDLDSYLSDVLARAQQVSALISTLEAQVGSPNWCVIDVWCFLFV